ncbi:hypothetical protein ABH37_06210 [Mycobacterium haemophilum]|uniref:Uncharacterized protein n=1 Tax=Mycobacterium haemophilum TaxID=29311 RepID=A0A0I9TIR1_9MYCO|nr:hypothetical protein ABH39_14220 [Mycobacterium haemophilum]KLO37460.1 hypothetical protein ABH38_08685 [Mycobacterium haemophilum]KLO44009.1 hypothetical protein ABH37_06210 [Mycobacterium haemophilum]KLO49289.1 hypothetical protein ABH36_13075 [Mycobacterium haemophilum]
MALLVRYARTAKTADLGVLWVVINGGEPIDVEAIDRVIRELATFGFDSEARVRARNCVSYACDSLSQAALGESKPPPYIFENR